MKTEFREWAIDQHDVVCNQKYDGNQPYSNHLKFVEAQAKKFSHLLSEGDRSLVYLGAIGHDLLEDARVSYNDILARAGYQVAEIIFLCTENKGRSRDERHNQDFYTMLGSNPLAVYVKLCDIIANVTYSLLTGSSMIEKYRKENSKTYDYLYLKKYDEMFVYLKKLLDLTA